MKATEILAAIKAEEAEVVTVETSRVGGTVPAELVARLDSFCKSTKIKRNDALASALEDFLDGYVADDDIVEQEDIDVEALPVKRRSRKV